MLRPGWSLLCSGWTGCDATVQLALHKPLLPESPADVLCSIPASAPSLPFHSEQRSCNQRKRRPITVHCKTKYSHQLGVRSGLFYDLGSRQKHCEFFIAIKSSLFVSPPLYVPASFQLYSFWTLKLTSQAKTIKMPFSFSKTTYTFQVISSQSCGNPLYHCVYCMCTGQRKTGRRSVESCSQALC